MPSPIPRQVGWNLFARTIPFASAFPRYRGGSAPALTVSRPAQRSLTLRPARLPSRHCDLLHQRLQQSRCLHCCSDCYRVERTSSRAGIPRCGPAPFTADPITPFVRTYLRGFEWRRVRASKLIFLRHKQKLHPAKHWFDGLPYHDLETIWRQRWTQLSRFWILRKR